MGLVKTVDPNILSLIEKWKVGWLRFNNSLGIISDANVPMKEKMNALETIQVVKTVALKNTVHNVVLAYTDKSFQALRKAKELIIAILVVLTIMALLIRRNLLPIRKLLIVMNALGKNDLTIRSSIPGNTEISNLENLSQEILNASNEQKIGGSELLTALDLLQEVSIRNKESIIVLDEHINKFTVSSS